jgi:pyruvate/oxaloacetate carboxyltransferase
MQTTGPPLGGAKLNVTLPVRVPEPVTATVSVTIAPTATLVGVEAVNVIVDGVEITMLEDVTNVLATNTGRSPVYIAAGLKVPAVVKLTVQLAAPPADKVTERSDVVDSVHCRGALGPVNEKLTVPAGTELELVTTETEN